MSMLFITHDLSVIADIADEVLVMFRGDLVEEQTCEALFENPKHPYTKGLLACRPKLDKNPKRLPTVEAILKDESAFYNAAVDVKNPRSFTEDKNPVLVEIRNLQKNFPIKGGFFGRTVSEFKAVDGVSLKVRKGRTFGLVGESGCGKTTLGRSVLR